MEEKTEEKEMEKLKIKEERRRNVSKYIERTEEGIFKLKHEDDTIDNTEELTEEQIHDLNAIFNLFDNLTPLVYLLPNFSQKVKVLTLIFSPLHTATQFHLMTMDSVYSYEVDGYVKNDCNSFC